ncbi:helix-turn-helix domain-containing protein [Bacillus mangrovi]|uniref:Helix-turn-helix domain-containing protein n=1 Tax=Metabacillus mangrovi TaxID=1491830 RepID=A0A7X2S2D1_9BACI|nr:helix-turn-helix domain-containing protein [Metabacillus mangrovi]MTH52280.1 helix-turn-helix domain-containing protein [Metabacillus mangrovi]
MEYILETGKKRGTYTAQIRQSLLWEAALGIAAVTNSRLIGTLEKKDWKHLKKGMPERLLKELDTIEKNNTWKALLQLLHEKNAETLDEFTAYLTELPDEELLYVSLPYLGEELQNKRRAAAAGEKAAMDELIAKSGWNPFYPDYIRHICTEDPEVLKSHLAAVMAGWHQAVIEPEQESLSAILKRDASAKQSMCTKMEPEPFIEWATGGIRYQPEPGVHTVLLIPHLTYRPWNIEADLEGTKVFYYPAANDSIHPEDPYMPSASLVQKHKALGDEVRLKLVKMLAAKDWTLQDMAEELGIGKTTLHHHLKTLKAARIAGNTGSNYYLNRGALDVLPEELKHFLDGGL